METNNGDMRSSIIAAYKNKYERSNHNASLTNNRLSPIKGTNEPKVNERLKVTVKQVYYFALLLLNFFIV